MLSGAEKTLFLFLLLVSAGLSTWMFMRMIRIIRRGSGQLSFGRLPRRIGKALTVFFTQNTVFSDRKLLSFFHALIAWAFVLYFLVNIGDVIEGFAARFHFFGTGTAGDIYRIFVDIFSLLAILAMTGFLLRRFIIGSPKLKIQAPVMVSPETTKGIARDSLIVGLFTYISPKCDLPAPVNLLNYIAFY